MRYSAAKARRRYQESAACNRRDQRDHVAVIYGIGSACEAFVHRHTHACQAPAQLWAKRLQVLHERRDVAYGVWQLEPFFARPDDVA
jgi:hypothetical protein